MYCPRCGTEYQPGDRFCSSCGANLKPKRTPRAETDSVRERIEGFLGRTRSARLLTAGTGVAIALAIAAFIVLPAGNSSRPQDAYTRATDRACVAQKQRIFALEEGARQRGGIETLARGLVLIVADWRSDLESSQPSNAHQREVAALDSALLNVEITAGTLARVASASSRSAAIAAARQVDLSTRAADRAIAALGLERCSALRFGFGRKAGTR